MDSDVYFNSEPDSEFLEKLKEVEDAAMNRPDATDLRTEVLRSCTDNGNTFDGDDDMFFAFDEKALHDLDEIIFNAYKSVADHQSYSSPNQVSLTSSRQMTLFGDVLPTETAGISLSHGKQSSKQRQSTDEVSEKKVWSHNLPTELLAKERQKRIDSEEDVYGQYTHQDSIGFCGCFYFFNSHYRVTRYN